MQITARKLLPKNASKQTNRETTATNNNSSSSHLFQSNHKVLR